MTTSRRLLFAAVALAAAGSVSIAFADTEYGTSTRARQGFVLGGALMGGHMGCETSSGDDCGDGAQPAGGFSVHVGGMASRSLALMGELWAMRHDDDNWSANQVFLTANVRAWLVPRLWLQGGLGLARTSVEFEAGPFMSTSESDSVPAFVAGVGVELIQSATFGLDLQLRAGSGFYRDDTRIWNTALGIGASWY
ncbi:MAG: outer membrane beta-barrel protein [Kofleriaceae bacterium]